MGLEVQLATLKVSLHDPFKSSSQKPSPAWWDHVSFYRQWRSDPDGEEGLPEQKPNLTIPEAFSLFTAMEPLQKHPHFMLSTPKTLSQSIWFVSLEGPFLWVILFSNNIIYLVKYKHPYTYNYYKIHRPCCCGENLKVWSLDQKK